MDVVPRVLLSKNLDYFVSQLKIDIEESIYSTLKDPNVLSKSELRLFNLGFETLLDINTEGATILDVEQSLQALNLEQEDYEEKLIEKELELLFEKCDTVFKGGPFFWRFVYRSEGAYF